MIEEMRIWLTSLNKSSTSMKRTWLRSNRIMTFFRQNTLNYRRRSVYKDINISEQHFYWQSSWRIFSIRHPIFSQRTKIYILILIESRTPLSKIFLRKTKSHLCLSSSNSCNHISVPKISVWHPSISKVHHRTAKRALVESGNLVKAARYPSPQEVVKWTVVGQHG